ncbi:MAG: type 1 glutamine amidotransferase [Clostridia bacterium]|nr:type 1 glutamine amidotransferase [Clostridia bacterium]
MKIVGITPRWDAASGQTGVNKAYTDSILRAGAAPVVLPLTGSEDALSTFCARCDGFLFSGGPDIDPAFYGEQVRSDTVQICPERDEMEMALFRLALASRKPMLGICRGIQVFNVMLGGTLYQDIPSEYSTDIRHSMQPANRIWHRVNICDSTPLHALLWGANAAESANSGDPAGAAVSAYVGDPAGAAVSAYSGDPAGAAVSANPGDPAGAAVSANSGDPADAAVSAYVGVNSSHHQAVKDLAPGLRPMAFSEDGLIEAVYLPDHPFFWGVQWHPEQLWQTGPESAKLFGAFVNAL